MTYLLMIFVLLLYGFLDSAQDKLNSHRYKRPNHRLPWPLIDTWHGMALAGAGSAIQGRVTILVGYSRISPNGQSDVAHNSQTEALDIRRDCNG